MQSFADLGVSNAVVQTLAREGINEPFAVQQLVIADILAGRDVLTRSPTGSGKTLAFGIPLVDRIEADGPRPAALILAPTRELATQIAADLREIAHSRALRVTAVYGGVGLVQQAKRAAASHIIVATPGRLEDLLARRAFSLNAIQVLILDEADRMLDMGFKPAVDRIVNACPAERQTLFFSATLDGEAGAVARRYTHRRRRSRARPVGPSRHRRRRAPVRAAARRGPAGRAGQGAVGRSRPRARVRAHQARRRPSRQAPRRQRDRRRRDARQQVPAPARERAVAV